MGMCFLMSLLEECGSDNPKYEFRSEVNMKNQIEDLALFGGFQKNSMSSGLEL
jgi:hypothetical protein